MSTCSKSDPAPALQFLANPDTNALTGQVSQSCQFAVRLSICYRPSSFKAYTSPQPFNFNYTYLTNDTQVYNSEVSVLNPYKGGVFQQAVSALSTTDQQAYQLNGGGYSVYGYEYVPGTSDAVRGLSHAISA